MKKQLKDKKEKGYRRISNPGVNIEHAGKKKRLSMLDRWELLDENGKGAIVCRTDVPGMGFRDKNGTMRLFFGLLDDRPSLQMYDKKGINRLAVGLAPDGVPGIIFKNEQDKGCGVMSPDFFAFGKDEGSSLQMRQDKNRVAIKLFNSKFKSQVFLGMTEDGSPILGVVDRKGMHRIGMSIRDDNEPELALFDKKGNATWQPEKATKSRKAHKAK